MANCKDCVHVEVCREYVAGLAAIRGVDLNMDELEAVLQCDDCENFKDRSRFVELPSDGVMYGVLNGKPIELPDYISPPKGKELFIISPETVNVPFFKSKEEAEQALKERENDGKK